MLLTQQVAGRTTIEERKSQIFYVGEVVDFGLQVRDKGRRTLARDQTTF